MNKIDYAELVTEINKVLGRASQIILREAIEDEDHLVMFVFRDLNDAKYFLALLNTEPIKKEGETK